MSEFDVVVVGAGMAGLTAARAMAEAGLRVLVLEATERVGGRIRTVRVDGLVVELGAEFVHGRPKELLELIAEAGLTIYERVGEFLIRQDGEFVGEDGEERFEVLEGLKDYVGEDCSFAEYVDRLGIEGEERAGAIGYVEGFNAADAGAASVRALGKQQVAEDAIEGNRVARVQEGYERVPEFLRERALAAGVQFAFGARVVEIGWGRGRVRVRDAQGRSFEAARVVVAVPLGVLQAGGVAFRPEMVGLARGQGAMGMGEACRFTLVFRRRLWPEEMSFLLTPEGALGVWWTARPEEERTLTGWVGGPRARGWMGNGIEERVVGAAAEALGLGLEEVRAELMGFAAHDWSGEETTRGAYSWVRVGGVEAAEEMSEPVEGTIFFAGEHTDVTGHWGTVHGAMRSGLRAARQVLAGLG